MRTNITLMAIYNTVDTASDVVINLVNSGYPHENISLIATENRGRTLRPSTQSELARMLKSSTLGKALALERW